MKNLLLDIPGHPFVCLIHLDLTTTGELGLFPLISLLKHFSLLVSKAIS